MYTLTVKDVDRVNKYAGDFSIEKVNNLARAVASAKVINMDTYELDEHCAIIANNTFVKVVTDTDIALHRDCKAMFYDSQFRSIDLTGIIWDYVVTIDGMFSKTAAKKIILGDASKSEKISSAFNVFISSGLSELNLGGLNLSKCDSLEYTFSDLTIDTLDISGIKTGECKNLVGMFHGLRAQKLIIGDALNTSKVTSMTKLFTQSQIGKIKIGTFDTSRVQDMLYMFTQSKIGNINEIVSKLNTKFVTSMEGMFKDVKTNKLDISNFETEHLTNISSMFQNAKIKELTLGGKFKCNDVEDAQCLFASSDIGHTNLEELELKKVKNVQSMFSKCDLSGLDFSNIDTSEVTNFACMFDGSKGGVLDISNFDTSKAQNMQLMFAYSTLEGLLLGDKFITASVENFDSMFMDSKIGGKINFSGFDLRSANFLGEMFYSAKLEYIGIDWTPILQLEADGEPEDYTERDGSTSTVWNKYKVYDIDNENGRGWFGGEAEIGILDATSFDKGLMSSIWGTLAKIKTFIVDEDNTEVIKIIKKAYPCSKIEKVTKKKNDTTSGKCKLCFGKIVNGVCTCCKRRWA